MKSLTEKKFFQQMREVNVLNRYLKEMPDPEGWQTWLQ